MGDIKKESYEYLFLDIEWNQAPGTEGLYGREAIQIAAIATDAELQKKKTFSKMIRLSDPQLLSKETVKISHMPLENIMQGKSGDIVLKNFAQAFPDYRYVVVWNRDTYDLLKRDMRKFNISFKKHRPVILQEILGIITGKRERLIGFETALQSAGIEYLPNYLHYSKHDVNYLYQLFCKCFQQYDEKTKDEICMVNIATRTLHTKDCRYTQKMYQENICIKPKTCLFESFTICKCCGDDQVWKRLNWKCQKVQKEKKKNRICVCQKRDWKNLPLTEKNIEAICSQFQVSYSISNDVVFLRTAFARWIVYLRDDKVAELFHENYRPCRSQAFRMHKVKCTEGYHKQNLPSENFFEVLRYIDSHDSGTVKRMAKKSRVEMLFEMLEKENENLE